MRTEKPSSSHSHKPVESHKAQELGELTFFRPPVQVIHVIEGKHFALRLTEYDSQIVSAELDAIKDGEPLLTFYTHRAAAAFSSKKLGDTLTTLSELSLGQIYERHLATTDTWVARSPSRQDIGELIDCPIPLLPSLRDFCYFPGVVDDIKIAVFTTAFGTTRVTSRIDTDTACMLLLIKEEPLDSQHTSTRAFYVLSNSHDIARRADIRAELNHRRLGIVETFQPNAWESFEEFLERNPAEIFEIPCTHSSIERLESCARDGIIDESLYTRYPRLFRLMECPETGAIGTLQLGLRCARFHFISHNSALSDSISMNFETYQLSSSSQIRFFHSLFSDLMSTDPLRRKDALNRIHDPVKFLSKEGQRSLDNLHLFPLVDTISMLRPKIESSAPSPLNTISEHAYERLLEIPNIRIRSLDYSELSKLRRILDGVRGFQMNLPHSTIRNKPQLFLSLQVARLNDGTAEITCQNGLGGDAKLKLDATCTELPENFDEIVLRVATALSLQTSSSWHTVLWTLESIAENTAGGSSALTVDGIPRSYDESTRVLVDAAGELFSQLSNIEQTFIPDASLRCDSTEELTMVIPGKLEGKLKLRRGLLTEVWISQGKAHGLHPTIFDVYRQPGLPIQSPETYSALYSLMGIIRGSTRNAETEEQHKKVFRSIFPHESTATDTP